MRTYHRNKQRTGSVLVLTAVMMMVMFGILALAVDLGYIHVVRSEMQTAADATALAAAWELIDEDCLTGEGDPPYTIAYCREVASQFASLNPVAGSPPQLGEDDVTIGYLSDANGPMCFDDPSRFNAVQISVRRDGSQNGPVSLFFARVLGINTFTGQAQATAMFLNNFAGFTTPPDGGNLQMLPLALDQETWNDLLAGNASDDWTWNPGSEDAPGYVSDGPDGVLEVNLFPQGMGAPGNRGTVDVGNNNNSTNDIARQILHGISEEDLAYHGGSLEFDENGELILNGDTGISAGMKDELATVKGQPRIIPVFSQVQGNGNNAYYTIVGFAGVRIMEVNLTGQISSKRVIIQPAMIQVTGGIPASGDPTSYFVHSPVWLVR
ncbi:MAG TPA: pilus assembly protein TadG-related protein [Thermoguttaceae bacterium]|nr:pilus assembly protein TadG-related protein [Thermoguttaceae bacterium]